MPRLGGASAATRPSKLSFPPANFQAGVDYAVLIANSGDRYVARNVVLSANDLLRGLGDVRRVRHRQVVLHLLLNPTGRAVLGGRSLRLKTLRVDFDATVPEQALRPVVQSGI